MLLSISSTLGIVLDVLIIAMLVIFGFIGFRKGFFKSVISLFSTLVIIIISIFGAGFLAKLINKIYDFTGFISGKLCNGIAGMHEFYNQPISGGMSGKDVVNAIPRETNGFLKKLMAHVLEPLNANDIQGETVAEVVSGPFASIIMLIISAIVLFVLLKIIIAIVSRLFENITRNRVFGATNKLLGFAFGAIKGLFIVVVFSFVLTMLTVVPKINTKITPAINNHTKVAKPIYKFTDNVVEKYVVEGKLVQNWIDDLWENKYKDKGNQNPSVDTSPNGTLERPYDVIISESEGVFTATMTIDFANANEMYYTLNPGQVQDDAFGMNITKTDATSTYEVKRTDDMDNVIADINVLSKNKTYIIKFAKGEQTQIEVTITLTPITQ
ncbi:MAG: CvpA family protein [Clostridia bacterium]